MTQPVDPEFDPTIEWDEEVQVLVTVHVKARTNPEFFEKWYHREPKHAAMNAVWGGPESLERADGFADLIGEARIIDVEVYP